MPCFASKASHGSARSTTSRCSSTESKRSRQGCGSPLAIYGLALGTVQGKKPTSGMIIHGRAGECKSVQLGGVHDPAKRLLRTLQEAHEHSPPRLILNGHCLVCEYRARCRAEAVANDDLSLLRGMGEKEVRKYAKRGIFTVTQLSFTFHPPRRARKPTERKVCHSHALQALAVREKRVHVLGTPELPRASTQLYLDIEGDPERGFCYLIGLVVRVGDADERHSFWIDSPSEEPLLLAQFLDVAALYPDAIIYTYGSYESAFLKRTGKVNGREEEVRAILARTFNVLSVVYLHVYFPVYSNGLKTIAGYMGFRWTEPDASGILSVVWRRKWEENRLAALKDTLITYNLEDCDALRMVSEVLYDICPRTPVAADRSSSGIPVVRAEEIAPVSSRRQWL